MIPRAALVSVIKCSLSSKTASPLCLSCSGCHFRCLSTCYASSYWSRSSKCSDGSFHADRAGRPALRQQDLFDAGFPLESRIWALLICGYTSLFMPIHSRIWLYIAACMHFSMHTHRHSSFRHMAKCVSLACGLKSFISLTLALISILGCAN